MIPLAGLYDGKIKDLERGLNRSKKGKVENVVLTKSF